MLAVIGVAFLTGVTGRAAIARPALAAFAVLCLADWVLIEDFGFFGGLGTDPNSMIPMGLLAAAGFLALTRRRRPWSLRSPRRPLGLGPLPGLRGR